MTSTLEPKELRADAQRNLARVLDAARAVLAEQGVDAPVSAIAERAGVGVGTVFRRFPTKDELLAALFAQRGRTLVEAADEALRRSDAGGAFRDFVEAAAGMQLADRGFCDSVGSHLFARAELRELFETVRLRTRALVKRAQAAGELRLDVTAEDVLVLVHGVAHTGQMLEEAAPGAWRRYLGLALDGLRPPAATPLRHRPLTRAQFERAAGGS